MSEKYNEHELNEEALKNVTGGSSSGAPDCYCLSVADWPGDCKTCGYYASCTTGNKIKRNR